MNASSQVVRSYEKLLLCDDIISRLLAKTCVYKYDTIERFSVVIGFPRVYTKLVVKQMCDKWCLNKVRVFTICGVCMCWAPGGDNTTFDNTGYGWLKCRSSDREPPNTVLNHIAFLSVLYIKYLQSIFMCLKYMSTCVMSTQCVTKQINEEFPARNVSPLQIYTNTVCADRQPSLRRMQMEILSIFMSKTENPLRHNARTLKQRCIYTQTHC